MKYLKMCLISLILLSPQIVSGADCSFSPWKSYNGVELMSHQATPCYFFVSTRMAVDADGAPNAYHPDNIGLDSLANAGYPDKLWWPNILVQDPNDRRKAYTQKSGEFKGYFVSQTTLVDTSKAITDPARYADARKIPYLVFPGSFYKMKGTGRIGDLGYAINVASGQKSPFVVAEIGSWEAWLGEVSIALAESLGGKNVNPRDGGGRPKGEILYVVFPYSSRTYSWPISIVEIENHAKKLLEIAGGMESILACKKNLEK